MPTFHTITYTIRKHDPAMHPAPIIAEGILAQDLDTAVARCIIGYVCADRPIIIEQVRTVEHEDIPEGGIR